MHKNGRLGYQIFAYEYPHNQVGIFRYGMAYFGTEFDTLFITGNSAGS